MDIGYREEVHAIGKGRIIKESCLDLGIIGIQAISNQLLTELFDTILKFLSDKA